MEVAERVTADEMRKVLRQRRRDCHSGTPGPHTAEAMLTAFRTKLDARGERGIVNLLKNLVLEPRNPFEPNRRRAPRREVVAASALVAVLIVAVLWFNVQSLR
jgi:hypothetical protein